MSIHIQSNGNIIKKKKKDPKTELNFASLSRSDSMFLSAIPGMLKFVFTTQCVPPPGKKCLSAV